MFKNFIYLLLISLLLFSCSKKDKKEVISQPTEEEQVVELYAIAVEALKKGDAFYASKKFKEAEILLPQSEWAAKASLMSSYAHYSRNAYSKSIFSFERFINNYPTDFPYCLG